MGLNDVDGLQEHVHRRAGVSGEPLVQLVHRHLEHAPQHMAISDDARRTAQR
jgi:hypothetical protein